MGAFLALILAVLLSSCASTPFGPVPGRTTFTENNLSFLDARALRVVVALPEGFELDVDRTQLRAAIYSSSSRRDESYALQLLDASPGKRAGGSLSSPVAVTTYEMNLTDGAARSLRELQGQVSLGNVKGFSLDVNVRVKQFPAGSTSSKVWIDLMLWPMQGFFTFVDGGTIPVGGS
jgi:hypothetical protein